MKKNKKMQDGGIFTPNGRLKSKKTRNVDVAGNQTAADVSKTKKDGTTITKSVNTSRGFVPTATQTKTVTDKSGNVVSKESEAIGYNKALRKTQRVANNVGRNANDTWRYKTGGMVNSNAKVSALKSAGSKGVKSGENAKVSASKKAKGRPAKSTSPKKAKP
jgi:hypothetical protein